MRKLIDNSTQTLVTITAPTNGPTITDPGSLTSISAQCNVTVNTPAAKTFASTAVNTSTSKVTVTAHGFFTGLVGQLTTTGGLPTGLSTSTNYFIIIFDANTIQFASSYANAVAGTAISLSTQGTGNDTFTPTALASGAVQLQKSNDGLTFVNDGSSVSVSTTGTFWLENTGPAAKFWQVAYTLASGSFKSSTVICLKGDVP